MTVRSFVVFAEMRTGSNHLEESLNQLDGVRCLGELFNPVFLGGQGTTEFYGWDMEARDKDPLGFLDHIQSGPGLPGFRYFHDHEPRVLDALLEDRTCAKVILRRDPLESYVSLKIARETGQWRMTNPSHRRSAKVRFDEREYAERLAQLEAFQATIRRRLAVTGQAPFDLSYGQINDVAVLNGMAMFLGIEARLAAPSGRLKRQNPAPLRDKVENPDEMEAALARMGRASAMDAALPVATAEAALPHLACAQGVPVMLVVLPGSDPSVAHWLELEAGAPLEWGLTSETLRKWQNRNKDARAIAVISHPVARAFRLYRLTADDVPTQEGFLSFLDAILHGKGPAVSPEWAPQSELLAALAEHLVPDAVLRAGEVAETLPGVWSRVGMQEPDALPVPKADPELAALYDERVEAAVRKIYNPDYRMFGFRKWGAERAP